jgi:hypothetical protein
MKSYELNFLEEAASRMWLAASAKIESKLASAPHGNQVFSIRDGNKIKDIAAADKYFLTIFSQHARCNDCGEPKAWLH